MDSYSREATLTDVQYVVVDVETHKTDTYEGKELLGVAIAYTSNDELVTEYWLPDKLEELKKFLVGKEIICHNAAFDLRILEENGITSELPVWDTMIMAHLVNENRFSYDLDNLAKLYLGEEKEDLKLFEKAYGGWEKIPTEVMGIYAKKDAELTYRLWVILRGELDKQGLGRVWKHSRDYILTLKSVMEVGIPIDLQLAASMSAEAVSEMRQLESELGFVPSKSSELAKRLFVTFDPSPSLLTPTGKPKLDDAALRYYALNHEEVKDLVKQTLRYRNLMKANSTWYQGFQELAGSDGSLHPGLKQHGTVTGRLSCAKPNLQQLPRDSSRVKALFKPKPEHVLLEFDYSQIELRLGSYYAWKMFKDPVMYEAYKEAIDVHSLTAEAIGAPRQGGKTGNFLWLYGGGAERFRVMMWDQFNIEVSPQEALAWTESFHRTYPGYRKCSMYFMQQAKGQGYVKMWTGRKRHYRRGDKYRTAWNSVVQGGCGQILMASMNLIHKKRLRSLMCLTVHDSILFHVPLDHVETETEAISTLMKFVPEKFFDMPFEVDCKEFGK